jgi:YfiH family protein
MHIVERGEYCFLDKIFPDGVTAGFTKGGLRGDLPDDVRKAFPRKAPGGIGVSFLKQVHGSEVVSVENEGLYVGDGLFTEKSALALAVKTADCLPLFLYSDDLSVAGMLHVGWRSAAGGILGNTGQDLSKFRVAAGVGLRKCCYEVGEEFRDNKRVSPFLEIRGGKLFFDPIGFVREELMEQGLKEDNFFDIGICSHCSGKAFHSYRRDKTEKRTLSFIAMA